MYSKARETYYMKNLTKLFHRVISSSTFSFIITPLVSFPRLSQIVLRGSLEIVFLYKLTY